jgi:hypothetical protein
MDDHPDCCASPTCRDRPLPLEGVGSYLGWRNYATWAIHRHLVTMTANVVQRMSDSTDSRPPEPTAAPFVMHRLWSATETDRRRLAETLRELIELDYPLADHACVYTDLLGSILDEVDWIALAAWFLANAVQGEQ